MAKYADRILDTLFPQPVSPSPSIGARFAIWLALTVACLCAFAVVAGILALENIKHPFTSVFIIILTGFLGLLLIRTLNFLLAVAEDSTRRSGSFIKEHDSTTIVTDTGAHIYHERATFIEQKPARVIPFVVRQTPEGQGNYTQ